MHPILKCGAVFALGLASPAFAQSVDGIGAVPEPASWAMMLIGFGSIGIALRRRRQIARTAADRAAATA